MGWNRSAAGQEAKRIPRLRESRDFGQRAGTRRRPQPIASFRTSSTLSLIGEGLSPEARDHVVVVVAGKAMQKQSALVAVADTEGRVTVAVGVQPARAMTNERMVVNATADSE